MGVWSLMPMLQLLAEHFCCTYRSTNSTASFCIWRTRWLPLQIHTFKVYSLVGFSIFLELCDHHHDLISEYFITPKRNLILISLHLPFSLPWKPLLYLLFIWICLFWTYHVNGVIYSPLCPASLTSPNISNVHLCCFVCISNSFLFIA